MVSRISAQLVRLMRRGIWLPVLGLLFLTGCNIFRFSIINPDRESMPAVPPPVTLPSKHQQRVEQFVFVSDIEMAQYQPLFRELYSMRDDVISTLKLPKSPGSLINVYLFEDRDRYERFMKTRYPDLPLRRAFFVAQAKGMGGGDDLMVYTFRGDHIRQDLRHELTHALLHSVLKDVPLWLDEGLAEYFELPKESRGLNRQHLAMMQRDGFKPDIARLEMLTQVHQMNPAEYRESWAWVHFMLHSRPEVRTVLLDYLKQLRSTATPGQLMPRLRQQVGEPNQALMSHLGRLVSL